jgi:hypothetical protein
MIPEIGLLHAHFAGQRWNNENQRAFTRKTFSMAKVQMTLHLVQETE